MGSHSEFQIAQPPDDGITNVCFSSSSNDLLVSSWDKTVRLYNTQGNIQTTSYSHQGGVLDCCFVQDTVVASGSVDLSVRLFDLSAGTELASGKHDKPVRCVEFSNDHACLISSSWDKSMKLWDPREGMVPVASCALPDKAFSMCLSTNRVVVATAGRAVVIWDLRNLSAPEQSRDSSLKFQTRCVRAFIDGSGYTLSSTEGRVAVEYFDQSDAVQAKKYAFKCHRRTENGTDHVYPVNTMAHHPGYGTFATGGCDGLVNMWDGAHKKRLCQLRRYPTSIASLGFNRDGSLLAIASSYTFEEGQKDHPPEAIFIRTITDVEAQPKVRPS